MDLSKIEKAIEVVKRLRAPDGCPWDKEQTHESLQKFLLEESYEVLEAIEQKSPTALREELGDLLLQILLHSQIASEQKQFDISDVANDLAEKMVRRHPHVFGDKKLQTSEEVLSAWEINKAKEKPKDSVLSGIPKELPALQRSLKVIEKVSKVGFQWENLQGPLEKVKEELGEFLQEVEKIDATKEISLDQREKIEAELGDLIFTLSNVSYFLSINPEDALRKMLNRFEKRFRFVEDQAKAQGKQLKSMTLEEMDELWNEAKKRKIGM